MDYVPTGLAQLSYLWVCFFAFMSVENSIHSWFKVLCQSGTHVSGLTAYTNFETDLQTLSFLIIEFPKQQLNVMHFPGFLPRERKINSDKILKLKNSKM